MILNLLLILSIAASVVSWGYWLVALACLRGVLRRPRQSSEQPYEPTVSILKPVKGIDVDALENFASFCSQDYPQFELVFGVAREDDPAVEVIERLKKRFADPAIRLLIAEPLGANPKAAVLHALAAEARGEVLVISDSDIRVSPDYLRRVVAPLADEIVGLVTCLYRGESPGNLPARLAALHMDAAFAPSAALAWRMGTPLGLGATLALRAEDLTRAGGFAAIADYLLDDYKLADRIAASGRRVFLSDYVVESVLGPMRLADEWRREVRWSRGIRAEYPIAYPGQVFTFSLLLGLVALAFTRIWPWAWAVLAVSLLVRWWVGWRSAALLGQDQRRYLIWLPLRDALSTATWCAGLAGRRITWRGQQFLLDADGRLKPADSGLPAGLLARAIRRVDAFLRRRQGIYEFSDHPQCMLRISIDPAEAGFELCDGIRVSAGDPVCVLHFWNEHVATIPRDGPELGWAITLRRSMRLSLTQLAEAARRDARLAQVKAFGGDAVFVSRRGDAGVASVGRRYGFEWVTYDRPPTRWKRFHRFWENFLVLGLQWAFNPVGLRGKGFLRPRAPLWMSRDTLLNKYAQFESTADAPQTVAS